MGKKKKKICSPALPTDENGVLVAATPLAGVREEADINTIWECLDQDGAQGVEPDGGVQVLALRPPNSDLNSLANEAPGEDDGFTDMVEELQDPLLKPLYQGLPPLPFVWPHPCFLFFFYISYLAMF
jgi:hypothetical protein